MKSLAGVLFFGTVISAAVVPPLPINTTVVADAYVPSFTPELLAIAQKFQTAVQADRDWFLSYVKEQEKKLTPGEILPFHEKFGLTKEEYAKFAAAASKPQLERFGSREIRCIDENGVIRLKISGMVSGVGDLVINTAKQTMTCGIGESKVAEAVEVKSGGALGPWSGVSFDYPLPQGRLASNGRISLGRINGADPFLFIDLHIYSMGETTDISVLYRWKEMVPILKPVSSDGRGVP